MKIQFILCFCLIGIAAQAQTTASTDEQAIRQLVDRQNAGERPSTTAQAIFWSGAYERPQIGRISEAEGKKIAAEFAQHRANQKQNVKTDRLVVAKSGDVAYEYGIFNLQFDQLPNRKHMDFDGAYMRTWRKESGQWLVDMTFMRPFDEPGNASDAGAKK